MMKFRLLAHGIRDVTRRVHMVRQRSSGFYGHCTAKRMSLLTRVSLAKITPRVWHFPWTRVPAYTSTRSLDATHDCEVIRAGGEATVFA